MLNSDFKTVYAEPTTKDIKVGQVWKCLEDQKLVMPRRVGEDYMVGYMFDGFQVNDYYTYDLPAFVKYFKCVVTREDLCNSN